MVDDAKIAKALVGKLATTELTAEELDVLLTRIVDMTSSSSSGEKDLFLKRHVLQAGSDKFNEAFKKARGRVSAQIDLSFEEANAEGGEP